MGGTESRSTRQVMDEHVYKLLAVSAVVLVSGATVVYKLLEDWSWVDSLYFSVVAVTTIGFGDLTPSSDVSKLFTVAYVLMGIAIITSYLNARMKRVRARRIDS